MSRPPQRRTPRRIVDGVLFLDKPVGISSNNALQKARWLLSAAKGGHTGTLDPMASGLLPLTFGEATKFSQTLLDADKAYDATVLLGVTTTTADAEGEVLACCPVDVSDAAIEAAIATLRKALALGEKSGERWWEAENYRYLGELLLQTQQIEEAATCLQQALAISQAQGAKSFELRAAISLARFWQGQGKIKEAHALLAPIYAWFTEGFDTPDLIEAKALLSQLA